MISLRDRNEYFDEQSTLLGRVISGWDVIEKIEANPRKEEKFIVPVFVMKCGELRFEEKLTADQAEFLPNYQRNVYEEDERIEARRAEKRRKAEELRKQKEEEERLKKEEEDKLAKEQEAEQQEAQTDKLEEEKQGDNEDVGDADKQGPEDSEKKATPADSSEKPESEQS